MAHVPWKFVEKLFFNKELISGLNKWSDSFGRGREARFFQKTCSDFFTQTFVGPKKLSPKISCHNSEPAKQCMGSE